jgi:hypothetical protein
MSDERISVTVREAGSGGTLQVFRRFWGWLKRNFPLVTRSGAEFTRAKVEQEQAKAKLLFAEAEVESAKAEQIRAQTRVLLSDLETRNAVFAAELSRATRGSPSDLHIAMLAASAKVRAALYEAEQLGLPISIEELGAVERLLPEMRDQPSEE